MHYSLRTLVILTAIGPLVLFFLWVAWIAAPTPFMRSLADYALRPGILLAMALAIFSCGSGWRRSETTPSAGPLAIAILWLFETLAMWIWLSITIGLAGWILIWGDNGPPVSNVVLFICAATGAVAISSLTSFKIYSGHATAAYIRIVASLTAILLILPAPYFLWHLGYHGTLRWVSFFR